MAWENGPEDIYGIKQLSVYRKIRSAKRGSFPLGVAGLGSFWDAA